ncbi:MAG: HDOD domain-containing protein, partial [Acidobacteriota bacterium]
VIEYDPAVAANILRVANSAFHAGRGQIQNPRDAVVRLGTATLLNIVLGNYLNELTVEAPLYNLSENDLWMHSAVSSMAAKEIKQQVNGSASVPQTAAIAALVHDIGKLIMVRYLHADPDEILSISRREKVTFVEAESCLFGCDHAEVGGAIARKWSFPDPITEAIERHHQYPLEQSSEILDAVVLANLVAKTLGIGLGAEGLNLRVDERCYQRLGLDFRSFCRICAQTAFQVDEMRQTYGLPN